MRLWSGWTVCVLALAAAGPAYPQAPGSLTAGDRVRVTRSDAPGRVEGAVLTVVPDTLVLGDSTGAAVVAVPLARIRSLSVYRGRRNGAGEGEWIGGAVGFLAGVAVGVKTAPLSLRDCPAPGSGTFETSLSCVGNVAGDIGWVFVAGLIAAVPGVYVGRLVGSLFHGEVWEKVPRNPVIFRAAPLPGGGIGLGLSVDF